MWGQSGEPAKPAGWWGRSRLGSSSWLGLMLVNLICGVAVFSSQTVLCDTVQYLVMVNQAVAGTTDPAPNSDPKNYAMDTQLTLTAKADPNYAFINWSQDDGANTTIDNPSATTVNVTFKSTGAPNRVIRVTANFGHTLTMVVSGKGSTSPAVGTTLLEFNKTVDISATAADGYFFHKWTGSLADGKDIPLQGTAQTNPAKLNFGVHANCTVTANFGVINVTWLLQDHTGITQPHNVYVLGFSSGDGECKPRYLTLDTKSKVGTFVEYPKSAPTGNISSYLLGSQIEKVVIDRTQDWVAGCASISSSTTMELALLKKCRSSPIPERGKMSRWSRILQATSRTAIRCTISSSTRTNPGKARRPITTAT